MLHTKAMDVVDGFVVIFYPSVSFLVELFRLRKCDGRVGGLMAGHVSVGGHIRL